MSRDEETLGFPCDDLLPDANEVWFRGVDVNAPAQTLFRWLCQLKVAPYSYDWIDNGGRQSPRELMPGADALEVGQRFMLFFDLVSFDVGKQITLRMRRSAIFPPVVITYACVPVNETRTRLLAKVAVAYSGFKGWLLRPWFARADLFMMKKQFKTLKALAEGDASQP